MNDIPKFAQGGLVIPSEPFRCMPESDEIIIPLKDSEFIKKLAKAIAAQQSLPEQIDEGEEFA